MVDLFPPLGLVVRTPRLELRVPGSFEDAARLADLAAEGIHEPGFMPFAVEWTDGTPEQVRRRVFANALKNIPYGMGVTSHGEWQVKFVVYARELPNEPLGLIDVTAEDFHVTGDVRTGSWLGKRYQGVGYGKEMRTAVLALAFEGMGARRALTKAREGNAASLGVTRSLGYAFVGSHPASSRGVDTLTHEFEMTRDTWNGSRHLRPHVEWEGLDAVLDFFDINC